MKKELNLKEIEAKYESNDFRFSQEKNDFFLPQILDFVKQSKWINIRPEYQRRLVWDNKKKSLFIESLLMNLPIPPIFLFEWDYSKYEVMDGQQRLNSIIDFYANNLKLTGLERWKELNGLRYNDCPPIIQKGFDRRRISAIVLLHESSLHQDEKIKIEMKRVVFERLNTGGINLNAQEIRHCIYAGPFCDMLTELAGYKLFDDIWDIPPYEDNIKDDFISSTLASNTYFKRMDDCELVLRFFAFRNKQNIKGSVKRILDQCMERNENITELEKKELIEYFKNIINLSFSVFGKDTFRINREKKNVLSKSLYDAVVIALDRLYDRKDEIVANKNKIKKALEEKLKDDEFYKTILGINTADSLKERFNVLENLIISEL